MRISAFVIRVRSAVVASGRSHKIRWITPTASNDASPCRFGRIEVMVLKRSTMNSPSSIANNLGRALSGSSKANRQPVAVPRDPRHNSACSFSGSEVVISDDCTSFSPCTGTHKTSSFLSEVCRFLSSSKSANLLIAANTSHTEPSHVSWLTTESIFLEYPSRSNRSFLYFSLFSSRFLSSSSRGSFTDAAIERLCNRRHARLKSCEYLPWSSLQLPSELAASALDAACIIFSALACCSITRQCRSRRCDKCASCCSGNFVCICIVPVSPLEVLPLASLSTSISSLFPSPSPKDVDAIAFKISSSLTLVAASSDSVSSESSVPDDEVVSAVGVRLISIASGPGVDVVVTATSPVRPSEADDRRSPSTNSAFSTGDAVSPTTFGSFPSRRNG